MERKHQLIGGLLILAILLIHLVIIDDYGLTWDFHHHFFAGLRLWNHPIGDDLTNYLPFSEPDPRNTAKLPFGPLMSMAPVGSYILFFEQLKIMAFDNAYNISIVLSGIAGILFLYFFLLEAFGFHTALIGFFFIALYPRFWGDLHNNMKDVPQAAAFTLAIWLFWRLVKHHRLKDLLLASIAFAIAFNTKVNTLVVPIIAGAWVFILHVLHKKNTTSKQLTVLSYFILAPLSAFFLWWFFWPQDPIGQLLYIPSFFKDNTINIEVLLNGTWYCSGMNVPWYYPLYYLSIVTPVPIVLFFVIGLVLLVKNLKKNPIYSLLLLWFFIPIARYIYPKMGVIDGIRHFEEVVFPLAAIAAIGANYLLSIILKSKNISPIIRRYVSLGFFLSVICYLTAVIVTHHPYQIAYFNEMVGGVKGAYGKYDLDYWGASQKEAIEWINANAKPNARVYIVMAADVFAKYLRPDLRQNVNTVGYDYSDYVVVLNRQGFFYRYFWLWEYFLRRKPVYTVSVAGAPLTWIYDNSLPQTPRQHEWWTGKDPCIRKYW